MSETTYTSGTVTVGAGSTTVTGVNTGWTGTAIRPGDYFWASTEGLSVRIASVDGPSQITLAYAWPGESLTSADYEIRYEDAASRALTAYSRLLTALGETGNLEALGGLSTEADTLAYFTGQGAAELTALTSFARSLLDDANAAAARTTLDLVPTDSATDTTAGRLTKVGDFGIGSVGPTVVDLNNAPVGGNWSYLAADSANGPRRPSDDSEYSSGQAWVSRTFSTNTEAQIFVGLDFGNRGEMFVRARQTGAWPADVMDASNGAAWRRVWTTGNTTVDANGFIKEASPIVRLFADRTEEPVKEVGAQFARIGVGQYFLSDVEPLRSDGWQIEVPQDANGNRLVFVATEYDATARTLTVTTSAPAWSMEAMAWVAGEAREIPDGRWVDLRFDDPSGGGE